MANFSKKTQDFLETVGGEPRKILTQIPRSADRITPGDIIIFRYHLGAGEGSMGQRVVLIVKTRRGDGVFPGKSGKLVSCFKLGGDSETVLEIVIDNLYKKRRKSSYYGKVKDSLIKLLGVESFRTYLLNKMSQVYKVTIG